MYGAPRWLKYWNDKENFHNIANTKVYTFSYLTSRFRSICITLRTWWLAIGMCEQTLLKSSVFIKVASSEGSSAALFRDGLSPSCRLSLDVWTHPSHNSIKHREIKSCTCMRELSPKCKQNSDSRKEAGLYEKKRAMVQTPEGKPHFVCNVQNNKNKAVRTECLKTILITDIANEHFPSPKRPLGARWLAAEMRPEGCLSVQQGKVCQRFMSALLGRESFGRAPNYCLASCQLHGTSLLWARAQNNSLFRQHTDCGKEQRVVSGASCFGVKSIGWSQEFLKTLAPTQQLNSIPGMCRSVCLKRLLALYITDSKQSTKNNRPFNGASYLS